MIAKPVKILIIEDNRQHSSIIKRSFDKSNIQKFDLSFAETIADGFSLLKKNKYELLLLDFKLPDGEGTSFIKRNQSDIPIVIMTSQGDEQTAVNVMKSGALDYIIKSEESFRSLPYIIERTLREWSILKEKESIEQALIQSENRYRNLFENAPDSIVIIDPITFQIIDANERAIKRIGYSREELLNLTVYDISDSNNKNDNQIIRKILQSNHSITFEHKLRDKSGKIIQTEISSKKIESGNRQLIQCFLRSIEQRKKAQEKIQNQFDQINALHQIDTYIIEKKSLRDICKIAADQVKNLLNTDLVEVLIYDESKKRFSLEIGRGYQSEHYLELFTNIWKDHLNKSNPKDRIQIDDLSNTSAKANRLYKLWNRSGFHRFLGFPIVTQNKLLGVLHLFFEEKHHLSQDCIHFAETIAGQLAIAFEKIGLVETLRKSNAELSFAYDTTLEGWAKALELHDKETKGHCERVTDIALALSVLLGVKGTDLVHIRRGALLHDIGKMGIPDSILHKPGPLTEDEWELMKMHPVYAYEMLSHIHHLKDALDIPYYHHEHWDGNGYPFGIKGKEIPYFARIFAVVDVYDALSADRPYRRAWSHEKILKYIQERSGKQFDPQIASGFIQLIQNKKIYLDHINSREVNHVK